MHRIAIPAAGLVLVAAVLPGCHATKTEARATMKTDLPGPANDRGEARAPRVRGESVNLQPIEIRPAEGHSFSIGVVGLPVESELPVRGAASAIVHVDSPLVFDGLARVEDLPVQVARSAEVAQGRVRVTAGMHVRPVRATAAEVMADIVIVPGVVVRDVLVAEDLLTLDSTPRSPGPAAGGPGAWQPRGSIVHLYPIQGTGTPGRILCRLRCAHQSRSVHTAGMSRNVVMGLIAIVALVISWVTRYLSAENRLKRTLRAVRVWPIGELPEDTLGRVCGEAQPVDRVLQGPLTGRPCVYYIARIEKFQSGEWRTLFTEREGVPFLLTDPSGRAIIDPAFAEIALSFDSDSRSGTFDAPTPTEAAFLAKHGGESKGWIFNKKLRYIEAVIEPGERVTVLGSGTREPDPQGTLAEGYRSAAPTRLRLTSSPRHPLAISDDPSTTDSAARAPEDPDRS